jgi:predicted metal-dependent peptidase
MQFDPNTAKLISASLLRLSARNPFFGALALFAKMEATQELPTAATDGRDIFVNPDFFNRLTANEQDGLLLHEVLHAALMHPTRREGRDPEKWNIAADIVINGIVLSRGYDLPEGGVRDRGLEHLSAEEIYDVLLQKNDKKLEEGQSDLLSERPGDASKREGEKETRARQAEIEAHWRNALQQAQEADQATAQGTLPAGLARELQSLHASQLDWRTYLWRYLVHTPTDFTGFDRRFVGQGMYLDALSGESVRVFVAVDTSGSVKIDQVKTFVSEVQGMLEAYPHLRCELYYADAKVYGPYTLKAGDEIPKPQGGGGTDFRPFFDRVAAERDPSGPTVSVYLTDGIGTFPPTPPPFDVLWVVTPGGRPLDKFPFGEAVRLR